MRTARSLTVFRRFCPPHPRMQTPLDADPPRMQTPSWMQTPAVNRMTHRCKNITFPRALFAGGGDRETCYFGDSEVRVMKPFGQLFRQAC